MAESRAAKLIAAVLEEHGSKRKLKALIRDHGKREALTFVDPTTRLSLLQMSVVMGNIAAGMRRPCSLLLLRTDLLVGKHCLTCSIVHGAAEFLILLGADMDAWWDSAVGRPDMAAPPPRDTLWQQVPLMRAKRLFYKCYYIFRATRAARPSRAVDTWAHARLALLHLAASASFQSGRLTKTPACLCLQQCLASAEKPAHAAPMQG